MNRLNKIKKPLDFSSDMPIINKTLKEENMGKIIFLILFVLSFQIYGMDIDDISYCYDYISLFNNFHLVYIDIYKCTKPGLARSSEKQKIREANIMARPFTDRKMYNELFITSCLLQYSIFYFLNYVDKVYPMDSTKTFVVRKLFLFTIGFVEVLAIKGWNNPYSGVRQNARFQIYFRL
jgi:hypothetical protein